MITVRFLSLTLPMYTVKTENFRYTAEALAAVKAYAEPQGFSHVKVKIWDEEPDEVHFTATTPNGRAGRNVAVGVFDDSTLA